MPATTDIFTPQTSKDLSRQVLEPIVGENYEVGIKGEYFKVHSTPAWPCFRWTRPAARHSGNQFGCPVMTCYKRVRQSAQPRSTWSCKAR